MADVPTVRVPVTGAPAGAGVVPISLVDGSVRLPNNTAITARNGADSGNINLVLLSAQDNIVLGAAGVNITPGVSSQDIGQANATWRSGYFGTSLSVGATPAITGAIRLASGGVIKSRNAGNTSDYDLLALLDSTIGLVLGSVQVPSVIRTALTTPSGIGNGDWWVDVTGTSPSRVAAIKVRDGGVTKTIASITY